jgi:hypothetical protein
LGFDEKKSYGNFYDGNFSMPKKTCEMTVTAHLEVHIVIWRKKCATKKYYFDFSMHIIVLVKSQSAVVDMYRDLTNFQLLTWDCCSLFRLSEKHTKICAIFLMLCTFT